MHPFHLVGHGPLLQYSVFVSPSPMPPVHILCFSPVPQVTEHSPQWDQVHFRGHSHQLQLRLSSLPFQPPPPLMQCLLSIPPPQVFEQLPQEPHLQHPWLHSGTGQECSLQEWCSSWPSLGPSMHLLVTWPPSQDFEHLPHSPQAQQPCGHSRGQSFQLQLRDSFLPTQPPPFLQTLSW